jgi:hypothetical protein
VKDIVAECSYNIYVLCWEDDSKINKKKQLG